MSTLKELRVAQKLSQREVTNKLGLLSPQYLSNAERGLNLISPEHWRVLARLYKVETKFFYDLHMKRQEQICKRYL